MKFLCVKCDTQMQIKTTEEHRDIGSLAVVFSCAECGQETAMLTNPGETQMVTSLGIRIGKDGEEEKGRCPFGAMLTGEGQSAVDDGKPRWTAEASARLDGVPDMVRPMAKMGIEKYAVERGYQEIDVKVLDEAREQFGL